MVFPAIGLSKHSNKETKSVSQYPTSEN